MEVSHTAWLRGASTDDLFARPRRALQLDILLRLLATAAGLERSVPGRILQFERIKVMILVSQAQFDVSTCIREEKTPSPRHRHVTAFLASLHHITVKNK
jgi:hypothetical protein